MNKEERKELELLKKRIEQLEKIDIPTEIESLQSRLDKLKSSYKIRTVKKENKQSFSVNNIIKNIFKSEEEIDK